MTSVYPSTMTVSFSRLMQVVDALNCHLTDLTEGLDPEKPTRDIDHVRGAIVAKDADSGDLAR